MGRASTREGPGVRPRLRVLFALSAAGVLLGTALAPAAWHAFVDLGWASAEGVDGDRGFLRTVQRMALLGLALPWLVGRPPWRVAPPQAIGLAGPHARPGSALLAFAIALATIVAFLVWRVSLGASAWRTPDDLGAWAARTGRVLLVPALLVAFLEELVFRGWLESGLARHAPRLLASIAGAALYALAHAFRPVRGGAPVGHDVGGAFGALVERAGGAIDPARFGGDLVGLFLFGLVLSAAWRRSGTIWTSIGIHTAAILAIQVHSGFVVSRGTWGIPHHARLYATWPAWAVLLGVLAVLLHPGRRRAGGPDR